MLSVIDDWEAFLDFRDTLFSSGPLACRTDEEFRRSQEGPPTLRWLSAKGKGEGLAEWQSLPGKKGDPRQRLWQRLCGGDAVLPTGAAPGQI